jgi:hypothetical protein
MDATLQPNGPGVLPMFVERKDATVNVASLVPELTTALAKIGRIHQDLFDKPLIITSANDGKHTPASKHYVNKAVDVRTIDKSPAEQLLFITVLSYLSNSLRLMLFDERLLPGSDHVHLETAD